MKYIVKWVEMDDIYNYYPRLRIFSDYNAARDFQGEKEEDAESGKVDELYGGKIISDIFLEELKFD